MRINFVDHNQIQHVVNGFNELFNFMLKSGNVDANQIKDFLEKYFQQAGYREVKKKNSIENILIIHDSGVGDFIIMSAAIREIRRIYPKAHISLIIKSNANDLAEFCPYVDEVINFDHNCDRFDQLFKFFQVAIIFSAYLLRRRIDIAFNFGQRAGSTLLAYMSGAKLITDQYSNENNNFKAVQFPRDFFSSLVNYKFNLKNKSLEIWLSPRDKFFACKILQPFAGKKLIAISSLDSINFNDFDNCAFVLINDHLKFNDLDNNYIIDLNRFKIRQRYAVLKMCDDYIGDDPIFKEVIK